jgi:very-short-patch-repair endonuclease
MLGAALLMRRDAKLRSAGYRVLRVEAELVERDRADALNRIRAALAVAG